jgi:hypothetical protein
VEPPVSQPKNKSRWPFVVVGLLVALVGALLMFFMWKRDVSLTASRHAWSRTIEIERYGDVVESDWCDRKPAKSKTVSKTQKQRSTKKVQDGETCSVRKIDRGNGTFTEQKECKPKYKEEPVYDDYCQFELRKWARVRTDRASGSQTEPPVWPTTQLRRTGRCVGCEREGKRTELYEVYFKEPNSAEESACSFDQSQWTAIAVGSHWDGEQRRMGGGLVCSSLKPKP